MDKKNYWVIALMVALAVGLLAAVTLLRPSGGQNGEIVVTVDGAEYARVPLGQKQTLTVTQEDGSVNVVEISERGAVMASSSRNSAVQPMPTNTTSARSTPRRRIQCVVFSIALFPPFQRMQTSPAIFQPDYSMVIARNQMFQAKFYKARLGRFPPQPRLRFLGQSGNIVR